MGGRQTAPWGVGQLGARGHFGGAPNPISAQSALGGPHTNPPCKGSAHTNPPVKSHPPRTPAPPAATPRPAPTRAPRDTWTPAPRPTPTPTASPGPLGAWRTAPRPRTRTDGPATPPPRSPRGPAGGTGGTGTGPPPDRAVAIKRLGLRPDRTQHIQTHVSHAHIRSSASLPHAHVRASAQAPVLFVPFRRLFGRVAWPSRWTSSWVPTSSRSGAPPRTRSPSKSRRTWSSSTPPRPRATSTWRTMKGLTAYPRSTRSTLRWRRVSLAAACRSHRRGTILGEIGGQATAAARICTHRNLLGERLRYRGSERER